MMDAAALAIILASGMWLIAVAAVMAFKPCRFVQLLRLTASNWHINAAEQGLRLIAGLALIVRADASKLPTLFHAGGWFVVASSIVLLLVPLRLHAGYAIWWSDRLTPRSLRGLAPFSALFGAGLIYASI